tara:strand:+ start:2351 stop:2569 length:219 start_codon:yes stop_codon:yes gene_type:complete
MIYDIDIAKQVAKSLLQINAIILKPNTLLFGPQAGTLQFTVITEKRFHILKLEIILGKDYQLLLKIITKVPV